MKKFTGKIVALKKIFKILRTLIGWVYKVNKLK